MVCGSHQNKPPNKILNADTDENVRNLIISTISEFWTPRFEAWNKAARKIKIDHEELKRELKRSEEYIWSKSNTEKDLLQHVAHIEMEHTAMKSELNNLESRVSNSDKALERALKNLESHVGRLEKVQQQPTQNSLPPPPLAPPLPTRANSPTRTKQTNTNPDASVKTQPPKGKRFGMSPNNRNETLESPKNDTLKHPEKGKPPEPTAPTKKGKKNQDKQGGMTVTKEIEQLARFKKLREEADKTTMESMGKGPVGKKIGKKLQIFGKQNRYTV